MLDASQTTMVIFGGLLGLDLLFVNYRTGYRGGTFRLKEVPLTVILVVLLVVVGTLVGLTTLTPIEFLWKYFLGALFSVGAVCLLLGKAIFEGRLLKRWTGAMRSLYHVQPHLDSPYEPAPFSEIVPLFEPAETDFSLSNALVCAHMSMIAYQGPEPVAQLSSSSTFDLSFIENKNHVAILASSPADLILAFRGTDDLSDWLSNVNILSAETLWGDVHSGFLSSVEALWPNIMEALAPHAASGRGVWLTGHSLGAAMAVLASMKLVLEEEVEVRGLYTFAQPLLASSRFRRQYSDRLGSRLFRFETPRDEVPNQPPPYLSPGTLIYLSRTDEVVRSPSRLWKLGDGFVRQTRGLRGEHSMLEYLRVVEQARSRSLEEAPDE